VVYIGENVRRLRVREAMTQRELAAKAGITETTISRIERDEREPHMSTIRKLADALGVHPRALVGD
jgi:XRE family transcriptional regulator, regulator of sulfur utilization